MFKREKLRFVLCIILSLSVFMAGCAGHIANPVDRYTVGDEDKSCNSLYAEILQLEKEIALKRKDITKRDQANVLFFVAGFFIIVPWFFMDIKGSHEVELEALKARKNALEIYFADKNCATPTAG